MNPIKQKAAAASSKASAGRKTRKAVKAAPKTLVVVESPAKAKTIEKYLGKNYVVRA